MERTPIWSWRRWPVLGKPARHGSLCSGGTGARPQAPALDEGELPTKQWLFAAARAVTEHADRVVFQDDDAEGAMLQGLYYCALDVLREVAMRSWHMPRMEFRHWRRRVQELEFRV